MSDIMSQRFSNPNDLTQPDESVPPRALNAEIRALKVALSEGANTAGTVLVGNRCAVPGIQVTNTPSTQTDAVQELKVTISDDCDSIEVDFWNGYFNGTSNIGYNLTNITVKVGIRPNFVGTETPAQGFWPTGSRTITLEPGAVGTAKIGISLRKGQTVMLVYQVVTAVAQTTWPGAMVSTTGVDYNVLGTGLADPTAAARTVDPGAVAQPYIIMPPVGIRGRVQSSSSTRRIALVGDSIGSGGAGDLTGEVINGVRYKGYMHRALADKYPWIDLGNTGLSGTIMSSLNPRAQVSRDQLLGQGITDLIFALGTNDVFTPSVIAAIEPWLLRVAARGIRIIFCTIPPRTLANNVTEAAAGSAALRIAANDYFSARYPTLDYRPIMQDAANPVAWNKVIGGPTPTDGSDGIHPNQQLHDAATIYTRETLRRALGL